MGSEDRKPERFAPSITWPIVKNIDDPKISRLSYGIVTTQRAGKKGKRKGIRKR